MTDAERFLTALFPVETIGPDESPLLLWRGGDPSKPAPWPTEPWRPGERVQIARRLNAYTVVSTFRRNERGGFDRQGPHFAAGYALLADDVRTDELAQRLAPSARIETSPGNQQLWWFFDQPVRDQQKFATLIERFVHKFAGEVDRGATGVNRVARLPGFVNGKPKHNGFVTKLIELEPARRYTLDQVAQAFGLDLTPRVRHADRRPTTAEESMRKETFGVYLGKLKQYGLIVSEETNAAGFMKMDCPWRHEHTNPVPFDAGLAWPNEEHNGWHGGFECHHGHCKERTWRDVTDWIAERAAAALEEQSK